MADTNWQDFPDSAPQAADIFLAMRGAGGINPTMAQIAAFASTNAGDGTVGAPGQSFAADPDTGFYRPGANLLAGVVGGVEGWRLTSAGLGIGMTAPSYKLDVSGSNDLARFVSSSGYAGLLLTDTAGTMRVGSRSGAFIIDIGGSERVQVNTSGNVGINGPGEAKFQVNGWSKFADNGTFSGITLQNTASSASVDTVSYIDFRNQNNFSDAHFFFRHRTDGSSQFEIGLTPAGSKAADRRVAKFSIDNAGVYSGGDNTMIFGWGGNRWQTLYAVTSAINTSDEREKLWITIGEDRRAKDRRIALAIVDELGWYQRLDALQLKGEGEARWHFGARAQRVWAIVAAEGLCAPLVGEGAEQQPDPEWTGAPPPAWLCFDIWEDRYEPIMEEQQVGTKTVVVGREETGLLDAGGQPIFRDVTEEQPVSEWVEVGQRLAQAAGNRFGLRTDQLALLLAWAQSEREKVRDALIAEQADQLVALAARLEALEAA